MASRRLSHQSVAGARALAILVTLCVVSALAPAASAQCPATPLVSGLRRPSKLLVSAKGNILVAEAGDAVNAGRVSIVDPETRERRTLLDGLPSGIAVDGGFSGPSGLAMRGRTLYVAVGSGDTVLPAGGPGLEMPNPDVSSPIFSSVLEVKFSAAAEKKTSGFTLTAADHQTLADGGTLKLKNRGNDKITVRLVVNFPDFVPVPRPGFPDNVVGSNPYGVAIAAGALYVVNASYNRIDRVDLATGEAMTFVEFPPVANPLPFGPPFVDSVPDSVRVEGGSLLVTHLTGFPFAPGTAFVSRVDLATGERTDLVTGLTMAIDVLPVGGGSQGYYTLEFSTNPLGMPPAPGRLLRHDDPSGEPVVVSDCLVTPTSFVRDPLTGDLLVAQIATGQIVRVTDAP